MVTVPADSGLRQSLCMAQAGKLCNFRPLFIDGVCIGQFLSLSARMPSHYFLGSRLLATCRDLPKWDDLSIMQSSQVLVCPTCGDAWGRVVVPNLDWLPVRRGCPKHPWADSVGGSFIAPWRKTYAELPSEVLRYELQIRLDNLKDFP